jgi:2-amino-4-hydroxy-6-hydroxymethyldihydropteridine diphosphokinase
LLNGRNTDKDAVAFVGIGSNAGDRIANSCRAVEGIANHGRAYLIALSSLYETEALSPFVQPDFINSVAKLRWVGTARELLTFLLDLEGRLGRIRTVPKGPRTIDLDILLFSSELIDEEDLVVPHPELHRRRFAAFPCLEIEPGLTHPRLGIPLKECLQGIPENQRITRLQDFPENIRSLCCDDEGGRQT